MVINRIESAEPLLPRIRALRAGVGRGTVGRSALADEIRHHASGLMLGTGIDLKTPMANPTASEMKIAHVQAGRIKELLPHHW